MSLEAQPSRIGAERSCSDPDHTFGGKEEGRKSFRFPHLRAKSLELRLTDHFLFAYLLTPS